jgi:hypothetical protein
MRVWNILLQWHTVENNGKHKKNVPLGETNFGKLFISLQKIRHRGVQKLGMS